MKKLLYAINHRQTEDMISEYLSGEYLPVGAATYKEAIIEQLHSTGADVVLIRDSLPGSTSLESLLKRIRVRCPGGSHLLSPPEKRSIFAGSGGPCHLRHH